MVAKAGFHALALAALFLLIAMPHAEAPVTNAAYQVQLSVLSSDNNLIHVKAIFLNLTYYSKADMEKAKQAAAAGAQAPIPPATSPANIPVMQSTSADNHSYRADPLKNAPLYFLLEGQNVSSDGGSPACNPVKTDDEGKADCKITHYYNGTAYVNISKKKSCSTVQVIYPGGSVGSINFKPASESFLVCPESGSALSSLGFIIQNALASNNNMAFCFPAILIAGLLITSMYYSGRDPLSLFDLTTPRLPKTKQARISGGSTAMGVRTAVSRYIQAKQKSRKSVEGMVIKAASKSGASKNEAKKAIKGFFKNLDGEMSAMVLNKDATEADVERVWANQQGALRTIFDRYGMNDRSDNNRYLRKYFRKAMADVDTYSKMEVGMRTMQTARSPYGGRVYKKINAWQQKTTEKLMKMEEKAKYLKVPYGRILKFTPLGLPLAFVELPHTLAAIPHKLVDMVAQYRSAKGYIRGTRRKAFGHLFSKALTKENGKTGERESNALGRAFKATIGATGIAGAAKWMYGWTYDGYAKNHGILAKKIGHLNDTQSKYVWDLTESLGISPYLVSNLFSTDEKTADALKEWDSKKAAKMKADGQAYSHQHLVDEIESALRNGALGKKTAALENEVKQLFSAKIDSSLKQRKELEDQQNLVLQHIRAMGAYAANKDGSLSDLFGAMATAKGISSSVISTQLDDLKKIEDDLRHKFGIMRLREELLKNDRLEANMKFGTYAVFSRDKLRSMAQGEIDAVFQTDREIARISRSGSLSKDEIEFMAKNRVSNPNDKNEVSRKIAELKLLTLHQQIALKQGLTEKQVAERVAWMRANGMDRKLAGTMSSSEINDYKNEESLRNVAAQRLEARIKLALSGCEAVEGILAGKDGARFLLDLGDGKGYKKGEAENVFNEHIGLRLQKAVVQNMDMEIDKDGEMVRGGILSQFHGALASLNRSFAAASGKEDDSLSQIVIGTDPAGSVLAYHFRQVCSAINLTLKDSAGKAIPEVASINDFELLFAKGVQRNQLSQQLTHALEQYILKGGTVPHKEAAEKIADILHMGGPAKAGKKPGEPEQQTLEERRLNQARTNLVKELIAIAETRQKLGETLKDLRGTSEYARVCKFLGLASTLEAVEHPERLPREAKRITREDIEGAMLERMSLLEERTKLHSPKRREINAIKDILRIKDEKTLSKTSYSDYLFGHMLEKTENTLHKWGGEMLRTGNMLNGGFAEWLKPTSLADARKAFANEIDVSQRMEYAATRKSFLFTQYAGESSQDFETLLYVSRALNRGAEFAISKGMGVTNAAGSLLGAYANQTEYTLHAYAMQRAFYKNLVSEESEYYDAGFAKHMAEVKKNSKAAGKLEDYDEHAATELKRRGMLFMDAKRGVPYIVTADNSGLVPIFEFNKEQLEHYWDGSKRGVIVKKTDKGTAQGEEGQGAAAKAGKAGTAQGEGQEAPARAGKAQGEGQPADAKKAGKGGADSGKVDVRDYGALLSTLKISDFGSEVIGVVAARNANKSDPSDPRFQRINPNEMPSVSQLFEAAKINIPLRSNIAKVIAGIGVSGYAGEAIATEGGAKKVMPLLHFVNGKTYVDNFAKMDFSLKSAPHLFNLGENKHYQRALAKVGESVYDIFYDDTIRMRSWYAAQARARQAIEQESGELKKMMTGGSARLNANKFFDAHQDDDTVQAFNRVLEKIDNDRKKANDNAEENAKKKTEVSTILKNMLQYQQNGEKYSQDTSKHAEFLRRTYTFTDKDTAEWQSMAYGAEKSMGAIKAMYKSGAISREEYSQLYGAAKESAKHLQQKYAEAYKENYDFTKAVIAITGSHENTYYGSGRSFFTFLNPSQDFHYSQGYPLGFGMSIESTAMRDGAYNRGGRRGADSFEKMNMNTGQGFYENQRWWATSLYEQEMVLPLTISLYVHKALLPFASHVYRRMIGLSSPLQRTELETEWGKPSFPIHAFFGLKRGINDNFAGTAQVLQDYTGGSQIIAAMRKGGKVSVDADGNVMVQRSGTASRLDSWAVESPWLSSDAQIKYLNRLQDRMKALDAGGDSTVKENGAIVYINKSTGELASGRDVDHKSKDSQGETVYKPLSVKELMVVQSLAQQEADFRHDPEAERKLNRYSELLKPYITVELKDQQQESVKISDGGGHYFNIDGSRRRPWEIFMGDHVNTASQVIPGMTEYGPWMAKTLSPTTVNYFEHWGNTFDHLSHPVGLQVVKNGTMYAENYDEEANVYTRRSSYDMHRDAYRDVFRMESPAALQVMKMQSYAIMYDGILPIVGLTKSLLKMPVNLVTFGAYDKWSQRRHSEKTQREFRGDLDAAMIDDQLALHGLGSMRELDDNVGFKHSGYDDLQRARDSVQRNWFWQRWGGKLYENYLHRSEILALQSDESRRNMKVFLRQQMIMNL